MKLSVNLMQISPPAPSVRGFSDGPPLFEGHRHNPVLFMSFNESLLVNVPVVPNAPRTDPAKDSRLISYTNLPMSPAKSLL
jgi:hypothetical protein